MYWMVGTCMGMNDVTDPRDGPTIARTCGAAKKKSKRHCTRPNMLGTEPRFHAPRLENEWLELHFGSGCPGDSGDDAVHEGTAVQAPTRRVGSFLGLRTHDRAIL